MNSSDERANQRLTASREQLRLAWIEGRAPQGQRALNAMSAAERAKARAASAANAASGAPAHHPTSAAWTEALKTVPGATILLDALRGWWWQHPLRLYGVIAAEAGAAVAKPVAQRHPVALVGGAFVVGALLAWSRPWRWIIKPALFAGLVPQLASKTLAHSLAHLPLQSWLGALSSLAQTPRRATGDARSTLH
jgi:hypothetical protein